MPRALREWEVENEQFGRRRQTANRTTRSIPQKPEGRKGRNTKISHEGQCRALAAGTHACVHAGRAEHRVGGLVIRVHVEPEPACPLDSLCLSTSPSQWFTLSQYPAGRVPGF